MLCHTKGGTMQAVTLAQSPTKPGVGERQQGRWQRAEGQGSDGVEWAQGG